MGLFNYRARWTDDDGRSHEFEDVADTTDRKFIKQQIYAKVGANPKKT